MRDSIRVRCCLKCKVYIVIHPNNAEASLDEKWFNINHRSHTVQILGLDELIPAEGYKSEYRCVSRLTEKKE